MYFSVLNVGLLYCYLRTVISQVLCHGLFITKFHILLSTGQYGHRCEVIPKDPYIEFGSNIKIKFKKTCNKTISDSHGKIYWTINNKSIDESLYETNTSFAAVTIYNLSLPKAIVQCHSHLTQQVLGGTIIQTYCTYLLTLLVCVTFNTSTLSWHLGNEFYERINHVL